MLNSEYFLWGAGTYGARTIEFMKDDLTFKAVIDNDPKKQGTLFHGIPVISYDEAKANLPKTKIVIALNLPTDVRELLLNEGFIDRQDFFILIDFIPWFFWMKDRSLVFKSADISVTTICNMRCKGCCVYIPFAASHRHVSAEKVLYELELLFSHIDLVMCINICCGESLLNSELPMICSEICKRYAGRYHWLQVQTTGMVLPEADDMHCYSETNTLFGLSSYPENTETLDAFTKRCDKFNVSYYVNFQGSRSRWFDAGNPHTVRTLESQKLREQFERCWQPGMGLFNGYLYLCVQHMWAHQVAEVGSIEPGDAFDLRQPKTEASREELYKIISRQPPERGYISHCQRCLSVMNPLKK